MAGPGRAAIFGLAGPRLTASERDFFADARPWGAILFDRNLETPDQIRALTSELRACVGADLPIAVDQEGGRVQRLRGPIWREWYPALDQVAANRAQAARGMFLRNRLIAHELLALGIDVNCAPLADIARPDTHGVLRNRLYGQSAEEVARNARAVADGLLAGGVLPVLKHMPGHGAATLDSHIDLPRVDLDVETLGREDFAAFRPLADLPLGMTAHIVYSALGSDLPATFDAQMIARIRVDLGFDGALMTDDLSMGALPGPIGARAAKARAAGCDLILHCNGDLPEMIAVAEAAGDLSGAAQARCDRALAARRPVQPLDIAAAEADLADLLRGKVYV